ncbi:MAG: 50S ribosomal protein L11 methyltransferase [Gammaproteobacteria bacterium]
MSSLQLEMTLGTLDAERVEAALLAAGALGITFSDAADEPLYEPDPAQTRLWSQTRATGLFPAGTDPDAVRVLLMAALTVLPPHRFTALEDREWSREWLQEFKPMRFGKRLWICPTAYAPPDPGAVNVLLDPGLAFGSGAHATTALCLEWLDSAALLGKTVIDYGCGSGILAVAAARLGARRVWALDNDPQALIATRENAARNQVTPILEIGLPDTLPAAPADVLLANILAAPLIELAPRFAARLKPGGELVLSGILDSQRYEIHTAYVPWFRFAGGAQREEWLRMDGLRLSGKH